MIKKKAYDLQFCVNFITNLQGTISDNITFQTNELLILIKKTQLPDEEYMTFSKIIQLFNKLKKNIFFNLFKKMYLFIHIVALNLSQTKLIMVFIYEINTQ